MQTEYFLDSIKMIPKLLRNMLMFKANLLKTFSKEMMVNDIWLSLQDINVHYKITVYSSFGLRQSSRYDVDF